MSFGAGDSFWCPEGEMDTGFCPLGCVWGFVCTVGAMADDDRLGAASGLRLPLGFEGSTVDASVGDTEPVDVSLVDVPRLRSVGVERVGGKPDRDRYRFFTRSLSNGRLSVQGLDWAGAGWQWGAILRFEPATVMVWVEPGEPPEGEYSNYVSKGVVPSPIGEPLKVDFEYHNGRQRFLLPVGLRRAMGLGDFDQVCGVAEKNGDLGLWCPMEGHAFIVWRKWVSGQW